MPLTAASGPISLAQVALATSLSNCETFQDLVDADDAAEALGSIHHDEVQADPPAAGDEYTKAELQAIRPYALTATARQGTLRLRRRATGTYADAGKLHLTIVRDITAEELEDGSAEIIRVWQNQIGNILSELCELSDDVAGAFLIINEAMLTAHWRAHEDDVPKLGEYLVAEIDLLWGVD